MRRDARGAMERVRGAGRLALALAAVTAVCGSSSPAGGSAAGTSDSAPFAPALAAPPMAPPLDVAGGFCEYRRGHFHAGFDFSTGRRVGRAVVAPAPGGIERVRASGVGYGRSVYLRTDDGRLLVFAHLDAFTEPLAAHVRAAQDSAGVYEQDLWPEAGRFRFSAGDLLAWSGESGAGGPHLHFEIRRGDIAYHPQRGGLVVPDTAPPTLTSLTLEPLDAASRVAGASGPRTFRLAQPETLDVIGRLRAVVGARDGVWAGVDRMVPWEVGMEWRGRRTFCRFDSVSWATDMEEGDLVYDAGRVLDSKGIVLWSRAGFRPRVLLADAPRSEEAGTIVVRAGEPPRRLTLWARDLGGGAVERHVVLRPATTRSADRPAPLAGDAAPWRDPPLVFAALSGGAVRLTLPASSERAAVDLHLGREARSAGRSEGGWSAVLPVGGNSKRAMDRLEVGWRETDAVGRARSWRGWVQSARGSPTRTLELSDRDAGREVRFPSGSLFEDATLITFAVPIEATSGLTPIGDAWRIEPARLPLRRSVLVSAAIAPGAARQGVGLYRRGDDGWDWIGAVDDTAVRTISATSRQLGAFALFRDERAPRVPRWTVVRDTTRAPYSRWALEAVVDEEGSGVAARASWFEVDGRRVPTEWDPEAGRLRWRPAAPPARGMHQARIVATDRAGNRSDLEVTFSVGR